MTNGTDPTDSESADPKARLRKIIITLLEDIAKPKDDAQYTGASEDDVKENILLLYIFPALGYNYEDDPDTKKPQFRLPDNKIPDYALFLREDEHDDRVIFVEAKGAHVPLDTPEGNSPMDQIKGYMGAWGTELGVVTNGFDWRFLHSHGNPDNWCFLRFDLKEDSELKDEVRANEIVSYFWTYMRRAALLTGEAQEAARDLAKVEARKDHMKRKTLRPLWERLLDEVAELHPELEPREILDALIDLYDGDTGESAEADDTSTDSRSKRPGASISAFALGDDKFTTSSSVDALGQLCKEMWRRHSDTFEGIVTDPANGLSNLILKGVNGTAPDKKERSYNPIDGTDFWYYRQANTNKMVTNMRRIAGGFGYSREDLRIQIGGEWQ